MSELLQESSKPGNAAGQDRLFRTVELSGVIKVSPKALAEAVGQSPLIGIVPLRKKASGFRVVSDYAGWGTATAAQ